MPHSAQFPRRHGLRGWIAACLLLVAGTSPSRAGWVTDTVAGTGSPGGSGDGGPALQAQLDNPFGVVRGSDGALWLCEYGGHRIRRIAPDGTISTVAGTGTPGYGGDDGPAVAAMLNQPHELRFGPEGDLWIADMRNHAIRRIDLRSGRISTVAGSGVPGEAGDGGPARDALLRQPHSLQFDRDGQLHICDIGNHVIRRLDPRTGIIRRYAGIGRPGPTPDEAPVAGTPLNGPRSLDFAPDGTLWVALREGNQVFQIDPGTGRIHHRAGTGARGFSGNGGPALNATLSGPKGIAVGRRGDVYLVDTESHSIRRIDPHSGTIDVVAGTGAKGDGPDGDALHCRLARPHGIWIDPDGTLFVGDSENHRIRRIRWVP